MDHLFIAPGSLGPPPVPVLDLACFDGEEWRAYPERLGHHVDELRRTAFAPTATTSAESQLEALSVIQEWIFFGLATAFSKVCEVVINRGDLIKAQDGARLTTTSCLPKFVEKMIANQVIKDIAHIDQSIEASCAGSGSLSGRERERYKEYLQGKAKLTSDDVMNIIGRLKLTDDSQAQLKEIIVTAGTFLAACLETCSDCQPNDQTMLVWLSCAVLVESLGTLRFYLTGSVDIAPFFDLDHPYLRASALEVGLCPVHLKPGPGIARSLMTATDFCLAVFTPKNKRLDHSECQGLVCPLTANTMDLPRHRDPCPGGCELVAIDDQGQSVMRTALESGSFAVYRIHLGENESVSLEVSGHGPEVGSFVAFSHVWSHGLGNSRLNALPKCQLLLLHILVERFHVQNKTDSHSPWFWIDTLCVPLERPWRRKAIAGMRSVYRQAQAVLVIDNTLLFCGGNSVQRQIAMSICEWTTRLWTYQEACLAQFRLHYVFPDVIVPNWILSDIQDPISHLLLAYTSGGLHTLEAYNLNDKSESARLLSTSLSLNRMTTTKAEDEALCLATLLRMDTLNLPDSPNLAEIFEQMHEMPVMLIFAPGPRTGRSGFRALPSSFLDRKQPIVVGDKGECGRVSADGLLMRRDCYFLDQLFPTSFVAGDRGYIEILDTDGSTMFSLLKLHDDDIDPSLNASKDFKAALVMAGDGNDANFGYAAILVEVIEETKSLTYCHWIARLAVVPTWRQNARARDAMPQRKVAAHLVKKASICLD